MGNAILTRKGGGGADINGIVYTYKAKTDDGVLLNASEFVEYETIIDLLYSNSNFPAPSSGTIAYGENFVFQLNDSTFIWGCEGGQYSRPSMRVMTVGESGSVTWGTNTSISSAEANSDMYLSNIVKIDDSTFAFTHTGNDSPRLFVCSVSGTTLTVVHYYKVSSLAYGTKRIALKYFGDGILLVTGPKSTEASITLDFWFSFDGSKLTLLSSSSGVSCGISSLNLQYDVDDTHVLRCNTNGEVQLVSFIPSSQLKTEGTVVKLTSNGYIGYGSPQLKAYANVLKNFNEDSGEMVLVVISRSYNNNGYPTQAILSLNLNTYAITLIDLGKSDSNLIGYGLKFSEEDFMSLYTGYSNSILSIFHYVPTKMKYRVKNVTTGIKTSSPISSGISSDGRAWLEWNGVLAGAQSSTYNLAIVSMGVKKPESSSIGVSKTSAYNREDIEVYQADI